VTPAYLVQWQTPPAGYVEIYVGFKGLETPYSITGGTQAWVLIPIGECLFAKVIDQSGNPLSQPSPEVCPPPVQIANPPTHILVTLR